MLVVYDFWGLSGCYNEIQNDCNYLHKLLGYLLVFAQYINQRRGRFILAGGHYTMVQAITIIANRQDEMIVGSTLNRAIHLHLHVGSFGVSRLHICACRGSLYRLQSHTIHFPLEFPALSFIIFIAKENTIGYACCNMM